MASILALKRDMEQRRTAWHRAQRDLSTATYAHGMDSYAAAVAKKALKSAEQSAQLATSRYLAAVEDEARRATDTRRVINPLFLV